MELEQLYQDVILDHSRRPRNFGELPDADFHVHGDNPSCGDEITLHVKFGPNDSIEACRFTGQGCSICMASASLLTQKMKLKSRTEACELCNHFHEMLTSAEEIPTDKRLGDLRLLAGVRKFPLRVKCATLAWHALKEALAKPAEHNLEFTEAPPEE